MKLKLPLNVYSSDQLGAIAWELEEAINELRKRSIRRSVIGGHNKDQEQLETSKLLDELLRESGIMKIEQTQLETLLNEVKKFRESAPNVHIILAATPDNKIKKQLTGWLRQEISPSILCTFSMRADLGGGAIIRTGARQYDFSFRSKIADNKQRISEIFNGLR